MLPGEVARYELAGGGHHHHFQCLSCQRVFEVEACPGNLASLAPPGFTVEDHDLTLYGRCNECAPAGKATAGKQPKGHAHDRAERSRFLLTWASPGASASSWRWLVTGIAVTVGYCLVQRAKAKAAA
jgi:hypothetical protein